MQTCVNFDFDLPQIDPNINEQEYYRLLFSGNDFWKDLGVKAYKGVEDCADLKLKSKVKYDSFRKILDQKTSYRHHLTNRTTLPAGV